MALEARDEGYEGGLVLDGPCVASALRAQRDGVLAPDANRTLWVTYGTARGNRPKPDAELTRSRRLSTPSPRARNGQVDPAGCWRSWA